MGKWLDRLKEKNQDAPKDDLTKLTEVAFVGFDSSVLDTSEKITLLRSELNFVQTQWQACLWVRTLPHYKDFSESSYRAEREAFARMKSKMEQIRSEIALLEVYRADGNSLPEPKSA